MSDLPDSRHDLGSVQASRWTDQPKVIRLARLGAFKRDAIKDTVIYAVGETGELR